MVKYVTMTDTFMSGWGYADNKINKLVFICKDIKEAKIVKDNAEHRTDQKHINICSNYPYHLFNNKKYYAQLKHSKNYSAWYKENFFNKSYK